MRNIPTNLIEATTKWLTSPLFLLELDIYGEVFCFNNFSDDIIDALNKKWVRTNFSVSGPIQKAGGGLSVSATVVYDAESVAKRKLFEIILAKRPQDQPAKLWKTYWVRGAYVDPVLLLDGLIDDITIRSDTTEKAVIMFQIISRGNRYGRTPHIRLRRPLVNYFTPKGSIIEWNDSKWEIK